MRKIVIVVLVATMMTALLPSMALAHDYDGWDQIRSVLKDGAGDEFVKPIPSLATDFFDEATEFQAVQAAASWIANNMQYVADDGEVWTSSDQQYAESPRQGDCEDYAILLCALLRFHTQGGIPADRVWVSVNLVTQPGVGVVAAHAWVGYKLERRGLVYIEPQTGTMYRGRPRGMLNFNDEWVKGGGRYLAGPPQ